MPSPILTSANYPDVRAALDTDLSDSTSSLPDTTIDLLIYAPTANQDVLALDPEAETRTGEDANRVLKAAIFFCAARLAPVVVRLTSLSITTRDMSYQKAIFDPEERAAELRGEAVDLINDVIKPTETSPSRPTTFSRAPGIRGF